MLFGLSRWLVIGIVWAALPMIAIAQNEAPCTAGVNGGVMSSMVNRINAPYSGKIKTTFEQKLADGNSIRGVTHASQARDSAGKTRWEFVTGCIRGEDGILHETLRVNVYDKSNGTTMNWTVDDFSPKIVRILHARKQTTTLTPEVIAQERKEVQMRQPPRGEFRTEDLGTKTIQGVVAQGSRSTRTIPAGEEGNQLPLETMTEHWISRETGITLMMISDDPRHGRTTIEFEELTLGEPDPALFVPPVGYKVQEEHPAILADAQ